jgi:hypothetical protein
MDKKRVVKIVKIVLIVLIVFGICYAVFDYLIGKGYIKNFFSNVYYTITGYGPYGDPCFHEPGTPDPCGGS